MLDGDGSTVKTALFEGVEESVGSAVACVFSTGVEDSDGIAVGGVVEKGGELKVGNTFAGVRKGTPGVAVFHGTGKLIIKSKNSKLRFALTTSFQNRKGTVDNQQPT